MLFKILAGVIAVLMFLVYVGAIAIKLKDLALFIVAAIGLVLMLADLVQSVRKDE